MGTRHIMSVTRVETETDRLHVLAVLKTTYQQEKAWVLDVAGLFPPQDLNDESTSWFLAMHEGCPVGVMRVLYNPSVEQYLAYDLKALDHHLDINAMIQNERIAEIGRFAVTPELRNGVAVASHLIRAAFEEVVARGFTLLVTDVFENEEHSPFGFHTRVVGFQPVATHDIGELRFKGRRITMVLNIKAAYQRLRSKGNWFFRSLTQGWSSSMHSRLA